MVDGESVVNEMAFSYDGFNLMTTDVQSHSGGIAYDGAGNMTSLRPGGTDGDDWDENRTLTWDAWNRLVAAGAGGFGLVFFHGRVGVPGHSLPQRVNSDIPSGAGQQLRDASKPQRGRKSRLGKKSVKEMAIKPNKGY
ncbi:MAG: hypothetical protein AB7I98_19460 [Verrucomicrobiales bacterium]